MQSYYKLIFLWKIKGTLQRNDSVKYQIVRCGIFAVHTEETGSYELEAVICLSSCYYWFNVTVF